jgi:hypothetical protein
VLSPGVEGLCAGPGTAAMFLGNCEMIPGTAAITAPGIVPAIATDRKAGTKSETFIQETPPRSDAFRTWLNEFVQTYLLTAELIDANRPGDWPAAAIASLATAHVVMQRLANARRRWSRSGGSRTSCLVGGQFLTAEKGSSPDCRYHLCECMRRCARTLQVQVSPSSAGSSRRSHPLATNRRPGVAKRFQPARHCTSLGSSR